MTSRSITSTLTERPATVRPVTKTPPARLATGVGLLIAASLSMTIWTGGVLAVHALLS